MSKKNNKSRTKAYVDVLREEERKRQEERVQKQLEKDQRRLTINVANEIENMNLTGEKLNKMNIDKIPTKKKKKIAKKFKSKN